MLVPVMPAAREIIAQLERAVMEWKGMRPRHTDHIVDRKSSTETFHHLTPEETVELEHLREMAPARVAAHPELLPLRFRERLADSLAAQIGSWRFLVVQTIVFAAWISANLAGWIATWDPYPFILLNLVLSFQAAYTAPVIMTSQNRQASIDRGRAMIDSEINLQAALEIKSLHEKVDGLVAAVDQLRKERDRNC
jgi:uncharacterized membrane protein